MHRLILCSLILASFLLTPGLSLAGVYNLSESPAWPTWPLPLTFRQARLILNELRSTDDRVQNPDQPGPPRGSLREDYLKQFAVLQARQKSNALLGTLDRIDLSGCFIRLGHADKAIAVLEPYLNEMAPDDPARFLVFANLAMAYMNIELNRAIDYQDQALKAWPSIWAGWQPNQLAWYRRCERYFLRLLQSRKRENDANPGRWEKVDPLFPEIKFVGPGGQYEPGAIDPRMADKMPVEATDIVLQLLFWMPQDERLLWLFAEILNAQRDIISAAAIMNELVDTRRLGIPELRNHRKVLAQAAETLKAIAPTREEGNHLTSSLLWAFQPRSGLLPAVVGFAGNEALGGLPLFVQNMQPPADIRPQSNLLLFWRQMIVAFVAGSLVTILVRLQMAQWRRGFAVPTASEGPRPEQKGPSPQPS
jgi:tetratricopeptide (TPR) repeat protein